MIPNEFQNVTAVAKANIYFEGRVASHTILLAGGARKTLGLIYPGQFHFATGQAERMEIVDGQCTVKVDGRNVSETYSAGADFEVPANSGFDIGVQTGICQYICSFL
jgi:hypothetical protein